MAHPATAHLLLAGFLLGGCIPNTVTPASTEDCETDSAGRCVVADESGDGSVVVSSVVITPSAPQTLDALVLEVGAAHAEGMALSMTYTWYVDGVAIEGLRGASLPAAHTAKGSVVFASVEVRGGAGVAVREAAPVTVQNTAPTAPGVSISPSNAAEGDALRCEVVAPSHDPDADEGVDALSYAFSWTVDGEPFLGATPDASGSEVAGADVAAWQVWRCEAVASDGVATSEAGEAELHIDPGHGLLTEAMLGALRAVPQGSFTMGCVPERDDVGGGCSVDETPAHEITLTRDLGVMESEVTQAMWQAAFGNNPSYHGPSGPGSSCGSDCPVERVSWWEALAFANAASSAAGLPACYALVGCAGIAGVDLSCTGVGVTAPSGHPADCDGYRLPTEAEWEYAARGGEDHAYAGSDDASAVAWYWGVGGGTISRPVCSKARNGFSLCDMSGNVYEWTWDRYASTTYTSAGRVDPAGPVTGGERVRRGGGWYGVVEKSRLAARAHNEPDFYFREVGFRLVKTAP